LSPARAKIDIVTAGPRGNKYERLCCVRGETASLTDHVRQSFIRAGEWIHTRLRNLTYYCNATILIFDDEYLDARLDQIDVEALDQKSLNLRLRQAGDLEFAGERQFDGAIASDAHMAILQLLDAEDRNREQVTRSDWIVFKIRFT
jgi:hypothetical protein